MAEDKEQFIIHTCIFNIMVADALGDAMSQRISNYDIDLVILE